MSILIADSGSTKTEWCLVGSEPVSVTTEGLNPYYHTVKSIYDVLEYSLKSQIDTGAVEAIYFYGAGCDNPQKNDIVVQALTKSFSKASSHVYHDLLGAARACFFDEPGIACILGTGSNSCLYDGTQIIEHTPSLAFILGDEGSAGYFGKKLINCYFRGEVPEALKQELEAGYNMSLEHIMENVYGSAHNSRFVASYAAFLGDHSKHPFVKDMLREGFQNFISRVIARYSNATQYKVSFVGSVGRAYQHLISELLEEQGLEPGRFISRPMDRLKEYYLTQKNELD